MTIGLKRSVLRVVAALALIGSIANISQAATLTINAQGFYPNQTMVDASSGGLTLKSRIYMFFVTTDADILSVNQVQVTVTGGSLYQVAAPLGSNTEPPPPEFIPFSPSLPADSWITTPGATSRLGGDLPGNGTGSWGDLTNDGPQTNFKFAQMTIPPSPGTSLNFTGRISLAGARGPEPFPFAISNFFPLDPLLQEPFPTLPEPGSASLFALSVIGLASFRRRRPRA
jgi:hypothetical protein